MATIPFSTLSLEYSEDGYVSEAVESLWRELRSGPDPCKKFRFGRIWSESTSKFDKTLAYSLRCIDCIVPK
jgi:hypothetical protein